MGQYGLAYRDAWAKAGHKSEEADVAVAVHGFVGQSDSEAREIYLQYEGEMFKTGSAEIGRSMRAPFGREADLKNRMIFAGAPNEVADRIIHFTNYLVILVKSYKWM